LVAAVRAVLGDYLRCRLSGLAVEVAASHSSRAGREALSELTRYR
jgi:hypothetical protein